jgi:muramoyltetrapeptide carboxypeptidase
MKRHLPAAIGGDHACHLLPLLDYDLIARNPKVFMGYSDITVLNVALWQKTRLNTFNGPALITDFAEYPRMFAYTEAHFLWAVTQDVPIGSIVPAPDWSEEFLDWRTQQDRERPRQRQPSEGWTWLKPGQAEGRLIGGCIESLQHLRGTPYWPDWHKSIFFFETSEEKPSPATIDGILMDYQNMGVFEQISGMIVGRPMLYYNPKTPLYETRYNYKLCFRVKNEGEKDSNQGGQTKEFIFLRNSQLATRKRTQFRNSVESSSSFPP